MNLMTRYDPLAGRLDGLFNDFLRPAAGWENSSEPLPIRVDVSETAEAYTLAAEIPGVSRDEINVEIEANEVTISAETRRAAPKEGEKLLRTERFYGKTARRFVLPQDLDAAKAAAKFTDGVLELTLPKKAAATSHKIQIR